MPDPQVVVCSFHTPDDYYRNHAMNLRSALDRLGVDHRIEEIVPEPDQDWADVCRQKVPFLARICDENPDRIVFWIDVDCSLLDLPPWLGTATADLIGFQRGFGSPLQIGYQQRTRFWEPCFFGIGATTMGRKFIDDARVLEANAEIKATDDYFFEESWRANAVHLTFQVIPSTAVLHRVEPGLSPTGAHPPFFSFGSSGKVAEFKDKVVQHSTTGTGRPALMARLRTGSLRVAKSVERRLPTRVKSPLRRIADRSGLTQALTGSDLASARLGLSGVSNTHRRQLVTAMVVAGQRGEMDAVDALFERLAGSGIPSHAEICARTAARSFGAYAEPAHEPLAPVTAAWWVRPFPGNFGDWLTPLILRERTGRGVRYQSLTSTTRDPHLVLVGSVGRFIKSSSVVVGTGLSSTDVQMQPNAVYHSVRGPLTAATLRASGGPQVESFGDPGVLLRRILPISRGPGNGKLALVRHFSHRMLPLSLPEGVDELDVLLSHPDAMRRFVDTLAAYDGVITSAMHVMIACHSYGIPCALVSFEGLEGAVHGSGIKYRDYALGAEVGVRSPLTVPADLRALDLRGMLEEELVSDAVLDRVESAVTAGVTHLIEHSHASNAAVSV